jgi:UDP-N-acetylglucosamine--N-acetylmuramyl-(pentapeptide) pyrophosphoryl-undecaprenol N-acetylglucosamine transferase
MSVIFLVAGGTAGHVMPAIALGTELLTRGHQVEFITDKRGEKYFDGTNIFPQIVASSAIPKEPAKKALAAVKIAQGLWQSYTLCREHAPDIVVGFGGYPSFPTVFMAQLLKMPTMLHEQNAVFGRANRQVAKKAKTIAVSFPQTKFLDNAYKDKTIVTGNPVRAVFTQKAAPYQAPSSNAPFNLLVFGGSQGSTIFSKILPQAVEKLPPDLRQRLAITQQCRKEDVDIVTAEYNRLGVTARLQTFFKDMPQLYNRAHLILARAGASTVAEIAAVGRPALFVPLAASLDGDQAENARQFIRNGAGWLLEEKGFTPETLALKLIEWMNNPAVLAAAAIAAKELSVGDATVKLADAVLQAAE